MLPLRAGGVPGRSLFAQYRMFMQHAGLKPSGGLPAPDPSIVAAFYGLAAVSHMQVQMRMQMREVRNEAGVALLENHPAPSTTALESQMGSLCVEEVEDEECADEAGPSGSGNVSGSGSRPRVLLRRRLERRDRCLS